MSGDKRYEMVDGEVVGGSAVDASVAVSSLDSSLLRRSVQRHTCLMLRPLVTTLDVQRLAVIAACSFRDEGAAVSAEPAGHLRLELGEGLLQSCPCPGFGFVVSPRMVGVSAGLEVFVPGSDDLRIGLDLGSG